MTDHSERRTRFRARLDIERKFLASVNGAFGTDKPLMSMTEAAIDQWVSQHRGSGGDVLGVASILREAGTRAAILADDSREVFERDGSPKLGTIDRLHRMLEAHLSSAG